MIRLGACGNTDIIDLIADSGFDYMECGFAWLCGLSEERYERELARVKNARIKVEACNGMVPAELKVTGPDASEEAIRAYFDKAFPRAKAMGVEIVVFGSSFARNVPEGFPHEKAWRQIMDYLHIANEYCEKYDMRVAIEPLRRFETNIINLVSEATILASLANLPRIGVLGDTYHMVESAEPYTAFAHAGRLLWHVHICNSFTRQGPEPDDGGDYKEVFAALKACGYEGRVSIEARWKDFPNQIGPACQVIREARDA